MIRTKRSHTISAVYTASVLTFAFTAGTVYAQAYPTRPIRIVTAEAGASNDVLTRLIAQYGIAGQPVVVENRPQLLSIDAVQRANPDGYYILSTGTSFWLAPLLQPTNFNPQTDFAPITLIANTPSILLVSPSLGVNSVKDLITLAKSKPGQLNYASAGVGTSSQLSAELLKSLAGIDLVHVPFKGAGQAMAAVAAGNVQIMIPSVSAATSEIKGGRLKALAVGSDKPSVLAPGVPTMAETVPGYEAGTAVCMFAPAKTPVSAISILNKEFVRIVNVPEVRAKMLALGGGPVGSTPEALAERVKHETLQMQKLISQMGIKAQ